MFTLNIRIQFIILFDGYTKIFKVNFKIYIKEGGEIYG